MGADGGRVILFKSSFTAMLDGVANVGPNAPESHQLTAHFIPVSVQIPSHVRD